MNQIGFIGAGRMAQALAVGIANSFSQIKFLISDPDEAASDSFCFQVGSPRTEIAKCNQDIFTKCNQIFLATKPQVFASAMSGIQLLRANHPLIVSVMAGVPIARIEQLTGSPRVIRVMPNTPCLIGHGACAMAVSDNATPSDAMAIEKFLQSVGIVVRVVENQLDAVTGLSGSGPAYVFSFIESLIQGAVLAGMPSDIAEQLAIQTVIGSAMMIKQSGEQPAELRKRVASPGGTTIAGLKELENHGFHQAVISAVQSATQRARELGAQS